MNSVPKNVKSIDPFKSVIQKIYVLVNPHGGRLKVEMKAGEGISLK